MKKLLWLLVVILFGTSFRCGEIAYAAQCDPKKDIMLNTNIPFIGPCIVKDVKVNNGDNAEGATPKLSNVFVKLTSGLMRIVMFSLMIIAFLGLLIGGFMVALSGFDTSVRKKGFALIKRVIIGIILIGASGIILNLLNPNFFVTK